MEKSLRKQLQKWGLYLERFPEERRLKKEPREVQRHVLKRFARQLKNSNNHKVYNRFLKQWISEWSLPIKEATFTERGLGHSNLNMHRRVTTPKGIFFEKVYFNFEQDLHNVEWFYRHISQKFNGEIKIPQIERIYRGGILTVIYYEFLDLAPIKSKNREPILVKFSKDLYSINKNASFFSNLEINDEMKNVLESTRYKKFKKAAQTKLKKHNIAIERIHKAVLSSKHVLAHGHISKANSFQNSILVDWDTVCYYPLGFDPAKIYYFLLKKGETDGHLLEWLTRHYQSVILKEDWDAFVRNAFYYMLIFGQRKIFERGKYLEVEEHLIAKLRQFFPDSIIDHPSSERRKPEAG